MIGSATVARFAARGWGLYAVGLTAACGVLYLALRDLVLLVDAWAGDVMQQQLCLPNVVVLSGVLFHHYFDHFLLLRNDCITRSAPARRYVVPVPMHIAGTTVSVVR